MGCKLLGGQHRIFRPSRLPCEPSTCSRAKINDQFGPLGASMSMNYMAVGLPALGAVLQGAGHDVELLHLGVQHKVEPNWDLETHIRKQSPDVVGFSLHWHPQSWDTIQAVRAVRRGAPKAFIVLGGFTASAMHEDILRTVPEVDGVIRGDGEKALLALLAALQSGADLSTVPNRATGKPARSSPTRSPGSRPLRTSPPSTTSASICFAITSATSASSAAPSSFRTSDPRPPSWRWASGESGAKKNTMILPAGGLLRHVRLVRRRNSVTEVRTGGLVPATAGRTAALIARSVEMGFGVQACFDPTPKDPRHWIEVARKVKSPVYGPICSSSRTPYPTQTWSLRSSTPSTRC